MNRHYDNVIDIINKYNINDYWGLSPKYLQAYANKICGDYLYENSIAYKNSKFSWLSSFFWHSIVIIVGSLLSSLKSLLYFKTIKIKQSRVIAMPFCWKFVWFTRLPELIDEDMRIVYHPFFHFEYFKKNLNGYNSEKVRPEFYSFKMRDIIRSLYILFSSYNKFAKCSCELDNLFGVYTGKFSRILIFPILYGGFIKRFIQKTILTNESITWIMDYDYDYKYIVFNNFVHQLRKKDITIQIQHGSFVTDSPDFCNPVCDYSLCCSLREKRVIEKNNYFNSQIRVLGAPLQSFEGYQDYIEYQDRFDIIILLTATDETWKSDPQKKILRLMDTIKYKIKIRYRPKSKHFDKAILKPYTKGMYESNETTLLEDVQSAKIVVCFSEDALYTAIRCNKPILYVRNIDIEKYYDLSVKSNFFNIIKDSDFLKIDLEKLIGSSRNCSYENDLFILNNFGYIQFKELKKQLKKVLDEIKR